MQSHVVGESGNHLVVSLGKGELCETAREHTLCYRLVEVITKAQLCQTARKHALRYRLIEASSKAQFCQPVKRKEMSDVQHSMDAA